MTADQPLVTVISLCFNHERFVLECLESVRAQTYTNIEWIIIDDCSRDRSAQLIDDWIRESGCCARFIAHDKNVGVCRSINEALSYASGMYVAMIATDDAWLPDRLEKQVQHFQTIAQNNVALVYSDVSRMDESGQPIDPTWLEAQLSGATPPSGQILSDLLNHNVIHPLGALIRRDALTAVGPYDERQLAEDYDMWLRLAEVYELSFLPGVVARYRIVATSITRTEFTKPSAAFAFGKFCLTERWLKTNKLTPEQRRKWAKQQADAAYWLFYHGDKRASNCLWKAALRTRSFKPLVRAIASSFGLTRPVLARLLNRPGVA